ncbi:MAG: ABC transporter permease [Bacteroidales bacterium]|nr:ABC transporter permease [Bacteroidales bacterium]
MNLPLFIAKRLYSSRTSTQRVSRPAVTIATLGIAIGLAVMIVSVCVVLGFKSEIKEKVVGFGSHIQLSSIYRDNIFESSPIACNDSLYQVIKIIPGIKSYQRFITKSAILKTDEQFRGAALKGIGQEYNLDFLKKHLQEGEFPVFSDTASTNKIVVSRLIADQMQLKLGDKVYCYFMDENIRARRFQIAGIYQTYLSEFDKNFIYTDLYTLKKLNSWEDDQMGGLEITIDNFEELDITYRKLMKKVNTQLDHYGNAYYTASITMLYPHLFSWLSLLDMNVWIILVLMIAVAGFTMISGLLIIILERTQMIGLLKALGATNKTIRHAFLYFAVFLIGRGMIIGNLLGFGLCWLQDTFGLIHLRPETYYVDTVPILINPLLIIAINVGTLIVSVLFLVGPSFLVSHIHPAKSMKFE